jgi:hypothetical protein
LRVDSTDGYTWRFTAPSNAASVTLTATFPSGATTQMVFTVVEPKGVTNAVITSTTGQYITPGVAGAWMRMNVMIGPTNVSFYRVQVLEEAKAATNVTSYFTNHWPGPHDSIAGADEWHPVGYDNLVHVGAGFDTCKYFGSANLPYPWTPGGEFTWPIPGKWRVPGGPTNNLLRWSDQTFSLAADGKMTITKFGKSVARTVNNEITPRLP